VALYGIEQANPSQDMHHIYAIASSPELRMKRSNWLALCRFCHEQIEGDAMAGLEIKSRSNQYDWLIGGNHG
jgi:hypothetical protein